MFLSQPSTPDAVAYLEQDKAAMGYVMNLERAWAWRPDIAQSFNALRKQLTDQSALTAREIALLVRSTARALGDSYCSLAWGAHLAKPLPQNWLQRFCETTMPSDYRSASKRCMNGRNTLYATPTVQLSNKSTDSAGSVSRIAKSLRPPPSLPCD